MTRSEQLSALGFFFGISALVFAAVMAHGGYF
jgi:hypothetical protein